MNKLLATTALVLALSFSAVAYADDMHGPDEHGGMHHFMDAALSKLPEKDAAQFRDTMKQAHEQNKALHEKLEAMHKGKQALLTAPTFDKAAFVTKSAQIQKLKDKMQVNMTEAFATAVSALPQDERQTLADAMHDAMHKQGHKGEHADSAAPASEATKQ